VAISLSITAAAETTTEEEVQVTHVYSGVTAAWTRVNGDDAVAIVPLSGELVQTIPLRAGRNTIALIGTDGVDTETVAVAVTRYDGITPDSPLDIMNQLLEPIREGE
jgi:hypothetical protein